MAENTGDGEAARGELVKGVESTFILARQSDAVYDSRTLKLGFLYDAHADPKLERPIADKQTELTKTLEQFGYSSDESDLTKLSERLKHSLDVLGCTGVYLNCLGKPAQGGKASALATIAFLDYISENSTLSQSDLIKGAFEQANKILSLYQAQAPGMDTSVDFSAALVDRDGKMVVLNTKESEVVVLDKTGKIRVFGNTVSQAGVTTLETQVNPGEKIVLCTKDDEKQLEGEGSKSLGEIVESTAKPQTPRRSEISVVAAEIKGEDRAPIHVQRNDGGHDLGEIQEALEYKLPIFVNKPESQSIPPIKATEFAKTSYFEKYVGVLDENGNLAAGETGGFILQLLDSADVKALVPQQADESSQLYRIRLLKEIVEKMTYQGDYPADKNPLAAKIFSQISDDDKFALMSAEALLSIYAQNYRTQEYTEKMGHLKADWRLEPRAAVKSMVFTHGTVYQPEGEYASIHDAEVKLTPQARKDITAARIIAERFMDQKDPTLDITLTDYDSGLQGKTYRDVLDALAKRINDQALTKEERREAKKTHALVRSRFYSNLQKGIEASHAHNQYALTQQPELKTVIDIVSEINKEIKDGGIAKVKENYHGIFPIKDEDFNLLEGQPSSFFRFAMKGAEYFQRMALLPLALEEVEGISDVIYDKNWFQDVGDARLALSMISGRRSVQRSVRPDRLAPGPVEPEPRVEPGPRAAVAEAPAAVEPAAVVNPDTQPVAPDAPQAGPPAPQFQPTEPQRRAFLPKDFSISLVGDVGQTAKEAENFEEQMRLGQVGQNTVTNRASGFWQRGIFSSVFQEREKRFRRNILAKTGLAHLPPELIKDAVEAGKERAHGRNIFRRVFLDSIYNLGANTFGLFQTTSKTEAEKWLVEEVKKAKNNDPSADKKVRKMLIESSQDKEALAARLSRDVDDDEARQGNIIHQNEARKVIKNQAIQDGLVEDFFLLFKDYINFDSQVPEQVKKAEEQVRILMEGYCSENGVDVKDDNNVFQHLSLRDRLKSEKDVANFQSKFTVVGTSMKRVADVLRAHRQGFVEPAGHGIVTDPTKVQSWVDATKSTDPNKKLNFKFFEARGELSTAGNREGMLESAARLLHLRNERQPAITGTGKLAKGVNWVSKLAMNLGINEVTAATIGGYAGSLLYSMIPTNTGKAGMLGGVATLAGMPIPLMLATTTAGFPIAIPVLAGGAIAAGTVAAVREFRRLKGERMDLERQVSFSIAPSDVKVNVGPLHSILRAVYGYTDRKDIEKTIAHQRTSIDIIKGLTEESGLFTDPKDLSSNPPAQVDVAHVQKALRWMAEARARVDSSIGKNRRFIKYSSQLQEAQEQEIIDGASFEIYERLSHIFAENANGTLRTHFGITLNQNPNGTNTTDFADVYKKLVDAFKYNLLGNDQKITRDTKTVVEAVVGTLKGNTQLLKTQGKEAEGLKARDRAFRGLRTGASIHRFFGVGLSSLAIGDVMAEVRSGFQHTPESYVTGGAWQGIRHIFGEKPPVFTHSDQEYIVNGTHFKPPTGYQYNDSTHLLSTPDGRSVDVSKLDLSADPVKGGFTNPDTQAAFSQIGVKYEDFDKDTPYYGSVFHNDKIGADIELRLPQGVQVHGNNGVVDSIQINGNSIPLSRQLNLTDATDYAEFKKIMANNHLVVPEFKSAVSQSTDLVNHPFSIRNTEVNLKLPKDTDLIVDNSPKHLITGLKINGQTVNFDTPINPNSIDPTNEDSIRALTQALKSKGFQVGNFKSEQIDAGVAVSQVLQEKTITGEQVWNNLGHKIDHREWLQGNELKFHTLKANDTTVVLDMTRMNVKSGDGVFFFSRPGHAGEPIGVYAENNQLRLNTEADPSHVYKTIDGHTISERELARLVVNKNALKGLLNDDIATELNKRQDVFNIGADGKNGFIEAGKWENNTLKAMATIRGNGNVPTSITEIVTPAPSASAPHFKYNLEITRSGPQAPNIINIESASRNILNLQRDQEFAMGVVPVPFVEYSGIGKYPETRQEIGVRPRPPFQPPQQAGAGQPVQQTGHPVVAANNTVQANVTGQPAAANVPPMATQTGIPVVQVAVQPNGGVVATPAVTQPRTVTATAEEAEAAAVIPVEALTPQDKQRYLQADLSQRQNIAKEIMESVITEDKKDELFNKIYDQEIDKLPNAEDKRILLRASQINRVHNFALNDIENIMISVIQTKETGGQALIDAEKEAIREEVYNDEYKKMNLGEPMLTYQEYQRAIVVDSSVNPKVRTRFEAIIAKKEQEILKQIDTWEAEAATPHLENKKLKIKVADLRKKIQNKSDNREDYIVDQRTFLTGFDQYIYQQVTVLERTKKHSDTLWRGYLMVEPEDIPLAVEILLEKTKTRAERDKKGTYFKWLLGYQNPGDDAMDHIGDYEYLDDVGTVVVYGDEQKDVKEILETLASDPRWKDIDVRKQKHPFRRPGTEAYKSVDNREWRSLNYGIAPGYSEEQARNSLWRFERGGQHTQLLLNPSKEMQEAKSRLEDIYGKNKNVLLKGQGIFKDKLREMRRAAGNVVIRPTQSDYEELIHKLSEDPDIKTNIDLLINTYATDRQNALISFINDMALFKMGDY